MNTLGQNEAEQKEVEVEVEAALSDVKEARNPESPGAAEHFRSRQRCRV